MRQSKTQMNTRFGSSPEDDPRLANRQREAVTTKTVLPRTKTRGGYTIDNRGFTGLIHLLSPGDLKKTARIEDHFSTGVKEWLPMNPEALTGFLLTCYGTRKSRSLHEAIDQRLRIVVDLFLLRHSSLDSPPTDPASFVGQLDSIYRDLPISTRSMLDPRGRYAEFCWGPVLEAAGPLRRPLGEIAQYVKSRADGTLLTSDLSGPLRALQSLGRYVGLVRDYHMERTVYEASSLILWLRSLGFEPEEATSDWLWRFMDKYYFYSAQNRAEQWLKFSLALVSARLCRDPQPDAEPQDLELPVRPDWLLEDENHFLGGAAYHWFESRCRGPDRFAMALSTGSLKKRQPPLPLWLVAKAKADWTRSMFRPRPTGFVLVPQDDGTVYERPTSSMVLEGVYPPVDVHELGPEAQESRGYGSAVRPEPLIDRIRRHVRKIARLISRNAPRGSRLVKIPGTKSRLLDPGVAGPGETYSRHFGGEFMAHSYRLLHEFAPHMVDHVSDFLNWGTDLPDGQLRKIFDLGDHQSKLQKVDLIRALGPEASVAITVDMPDLVTRLGDLAWLDLSMLGQRLPVEHTSILEPFKVRHITRSSANVQRALHDLQSLLHTSMKSIPWFSLVRETPGIDIELLLNLHVASSFVPGSSWVSGDYTASTDNLDPRISEMCVEELAKALGLSRRVMQLFKVALTGHMFEGHPQTWGQLMGSVVSFPVLCMANLGLTLTAFELAGDPRGLHNCGVLINGDDIGFSATGKVRRMWRKVTTAGGLAPSVGKNFVNRFFLQLNSKVFLWEPSLRYEAGGRGHYGLFRFVPSPQIAVLSPPPTSDYFGFRQWLEEVPSLQQRFLEGHRGASRDYQNRLYLRTNSYSLSRLTDFSREINWFFPRSLGGFGLEAPSDYEVQANVGQLRAATWMRDNTDPANWLASKVGFATKPSSTSTYQDASGILKALHPYLEFSFEDRKSDDPIVSGLETSLVLSGRSGFWVTEVFDGYLSQRRFVFDYQPGHVNLILEERRVKVESGLKRWAARLRSYARKCGKDRFMAIDDVLAFRKTLVCRPRQDCRLSAASVLVDPRTLSYHYAPSNYEGNVPAYRILPGLNEAFRLDSPKTYYERTFRSRQRFLG